jgi:hypothetical protein
MRPAVSDAGFTLRMILCTWAAWVPVLQFVSGQGLVRPVVVIERTCEPTDPSGACSVGPSRSGEPQGGCAARADQARSGEAGRAPARCCICFFVGDLSMLAAPAGLAVGPSLGTRAPLVPDAFALSRDPSPPSPPPELG